MAYNENDIKDLTKNVGYNSNEAGSWQKNAVNAVSQYLTQLTPSDLLKRYQQLDKAGVTDLASYAQKNYGVANADDVAYYTAFRNSKDQLGRELTANEFSQLAPIFYNPNDTNAGITAGRQALASFAEKEGQSTKTLESKAPQYSGQVQSIFQDLLKRGATQDEVNHFGKLLATGEVDPYELRSFVSQMPELRDQQAKTLQTQQAQEDLTARQSLGQELQGYDTSFFKKAKEDVLSRYAQGGIQNSSSLDFALTNLMGDIQKNRDVYLSDIARRDYESQRGTKREDYLGNKGLLREDYQQNLNNYLNQKGYNTQRSNSMLDTLMNRGYEAQDYYTQQKQLEQMLRNYGGNQGSFPTGALLGGAVGGGLGAYFGGPAGAQAGYQVGSGLGGGYDQYQKYR